MVDLKLVNQNAEKLRSDLELREVSELHRLLGAAPQVTTQRGVSGKKKHIISVENTFSATYFTFW